MDLAIITEYFPKKLGEDARGGVEYRAYFIAKQLAKKHNVSIYTIRETGDPKQDEFEDMDVYYIDPEVSYSQSSNLLKRSQFMINAIKKIRKKNYDITDSYSHMTYPVGIHSKSRIKFATYHDVWRGRWLKLFGPIGLIGETLEWYNLSRKWDKFIAVSEYTRQNMVKAGVDEEKISVVYNGISFSELKKIDAEKRKKPTICTIARLVGYKRVNDLIIATSNLKKEFPEIQLEIVGTGPLEEKLKDNAKKLKLEDSITFHGFVKSHRDVLKILKSSHAFSLPSVVEGFGITMVEAMGLGIPYAASDIPPIREATSNGRGGILFKPKDIDELTDSLKRILNGEVKSDPGFVEKEFGWDYLAKKVEGLYEEFM